MKIIDQNWRKLLELNKDMIDTSDITIVLQHNESSNMTIFYDYAISLEKQVYKLNLS